MNRFTLRSALVLAVVLLLAGATTSFGQVIFSASAGNPQVRIGGMTETVGDITLTSNGATFPAGSGNAVITLTYSTTITNKTTSSSSATCVFGAVCGTALGTSVPATTGTLVPNAMVIGPAAGSTQGIVVYLKNLVAGVANTTVNWTVAGNTLTITFAPAAGGTLAFVNAGANATITIHGVRLNGAGLGIPPTLPTVSTFVNTTPSANLQLAAGSTSLTVGTLATPLVPFTRISGSTNSADQFYKLNASLVNTAFGTACVAGVDVCNATISINPKSTFTICKFRGIPQGAAAGGTVVITGDLATYNNFRAGTNDFGGNGDKNAIGLKIVEAYPGALTSKTDEGIKSGDGQAAGVWPTTVALSPAHEVDTGTRVQIDFSGLPSQIVVGAPIRVLSSNSLPAGSASGLTMDLVSNSQCTLYSTCYASHTALADVKAASGGAVSIVYEVTANTGGAVASSIFIPIFLWSTATVDIGTINIAVRLGPMLGSQVVRFSDQQVPTTQTVAVNACSTELFYPFVTNTAGFDTGIYVVNGGQTRSGSSNQSGICTARFFDGSTTGSTAVKSSTLPTLGPGQSFSFTASDATLGKPGFGNGYVQITCSFENAHGAAYVTFGYGTAAVGSAPPGTMYLALGGTPDNGSTSGISGR